MVWSTPTGRTDSRRLLFLAEERRARLLDENEGIWKDDNESRLSVKLPTDGGRVGRGVMEPWDADGVIVRLLRLLRGLFLVSERLTTTESLCPRMPMLKPEPGGK